MADEKKTVAASYVMQFYQEVQTLNHNFAVYLNLIDLFRHKYGETFIEKMGDEEKASIQNVTQENRYNIRRINVMLKGILNKFGAKLEGKIKYEDLKKIYEKLKNQPIFKEEDITAYTELLNVLISENFIQDLFTTSQDYVNQIVDT